MNPTTDTIKIIKTDKNFKMNNYLYKMDSNNLPKDFQVKGESK